MDLTSSLRKVGYDLIESPIRNHKVGQLWLKKDFDRIQHYYDQLDYALKSSIVLNTISNDALKVTSSAKNEYKFNVGITVLKEILKSIGLSNVDIAADIKYGKNIIISYDNSSSKEIDLGTLEAYLSTCDFLHPENESLLKNLNKNDVIVTTGILYAKNLVVEIETDFNISAEIKAKLTDAGEGKLDFSRSVEKTLKMTAENGNAYPIAVRANRLDFDYGRYKDQKLITDNRNFF